ncbi:MAG: CBS domain-containing protein [Rhodothermaceae bacterium]|nr:CBS domain-containing protein [Rhodothermaceae bacterium]
MATSIAGRFTELLDHTEPFSLLTDEERQGLISSVEIYQPGDVILDQGTDVHRALYVVASGLVRLMDVEEQRLIDMCGEGAQFGSYGLLQGGILPYEARAVEATDCGLILAERFRALLKQNEAFKAFFDEDLKRYIRTLDTDLDASGAFLLFDTSLASLLHRAPTTVAPDESVQAVAQAMSADEADAIVVVQDGTPVGVVTEGDLVEKIVAEGRSVAETPIMALVERPPIALTGKERLFDAVRTMMHYRIRRVVVVDDTAENGSGVLGLLSAEDISHFRGLDPVATIERIERATSIDELAKIRAESNRRMLRLYQQGVQSEDLLDVIAEIDDQLKRRLLLLVEAQLREEHPEAVFDGAWAWLAFGTPGRRESTLFARQDNGLVYADPAEGEAERAAAWYAMVAERACEALAQCGYAPVESGLLARDEPFRQPLRAWKAAFQHWAEGADADGTARAAVAFDFHALHGDGSLGDALRDTLREHTPNRRLLAILVRRATEASVPLSFFGRFELNRSEKGSEGFDLRARGLRPIVDLARALALEVGYLKSSNTFDRLRHVADSESPSAAEAKRLLPAFQTLADVHLRRQMKAAEVGETPTDWIDPGPMHKSQQNLLKETLKTVQEVQQALGSRYTG